jgi:hypothetical protein
MYYKYATIVRSFNAPVVLLDPYHVHAVVVLVIVDILKIDEVAVAVQMLVESLPLEHGK